MRSSITTRTRDRRDALRRALAVTLACTALGCTTDATPRGTLVISDTLTPAAAPSWVLDTGLVTRLALNLPSMEVLGDTIALIDKSADAVLLVEPSAGAVRRFGTTGGGPGDLRGPILVRPHTDGLAVLEAGNRRVSVWTLDGAYVRTIPTPSTSRSLALDSADRIYLPAAAAQWYVTRAEASGRSTYLGARIELPDGPPVQMWLDQLVRRRDGALLVFDNAQRLVVRLSADGAVRDAHTLPAEIDRAIAEHVRAVDEDFAKQGLGGVTAALREFRLTPDDRLFVRVTGSDILGLLVDPETLRTTLITTPSDTAVATWLRGAYSMTVRADTLIAVQADGSLRGYVLGR